MDPLPRYCYAPKTRRDYDRKVAYYERKLTEYREKGWGPATIAVVRILVTARRERAELAMRTAGRKPRS